MLDGCAPLSGIRRADAVIVGGGWTGLLTAFALTEAGLRVIVLEAGEPGGDASPAAASLMDADFASILLHCGQEAAQAHADTLRSLLAELPGFLRPLAPFREAECYAYAFLPRDLPALEALHRRLTGLGLDCAIAPDAGGCPFPVELSAVMTGQLLIEPEPLTAALIRHIRQKGGRVCGGSRVTALTDGHAHTAQGRADAPVVLLCTGKPLGCRDLPMLALLESRTVIRSRMQAPVPLHTLQRSVRPGGLSLTPIPGGAEAAWCTGRSGTPMEAERTALYRRVIAGRLKDWTAEEPRFLQEAFPLDGLPVIGTLPAAQGRILCASGLGGGFLGAMLAARVLTRHLLGRPDPADRLYSPDRPLPPHALRRLKRRRALQSLRRRAPLCSLCRCRLRYFDGAPWWACPLCGSAFGILGQRLSGPALRDARISALQRPGW